MTGRWSPGLLQKVGLRGVPGLPDLELELGAITALVGPRASGKSQLLAAIAWLLTGKPRSVATGTPVAVAGELRTKDGTVPIIRRPLVGLRSNGDRRAALPTCSYLRVRDRVGQPAWSSGQVALGVSQLVAAPTTDALAAEALVATVERCCEECLSGEVLLIEEPELLLTPQAQRYLYRLLRRFAGNGNQVLYSTRSPAFVDAAHHDEIIRLDLRDGRRSVRRTSPAALAQAERVRLAAEFDHERSEMFFARAVILVEGQTERLSLPFVFRALGHDPDAEGIAIVEVGGKSNLPLAARLLRQLEIPFMVMFDGDRGQASAVLDQTIRKAAGQAPTVRLVPDFEAVAGIASHQQKVLNAFERFANAPSDAIPGALASVVQGALGLLGRPSTPRTSAAPQVDF